MQNEPFPESDIDDHPAARFVNKVILDAIVRGADQIELELDGAPHEESAGFSVAYVTSNQRERVAELPASLWVEVINRIKVMARAVDYGDHRSEYPVIEFRLSKSRSQKIELKSNPNPHKDSLLIMEMT